MFAILVGCSKSRESVEPNIVIGRWETIAPEYKDRFIDIRRNSIAFGTGEENFESYTITSMIRDSSEGIPEYTIYHKSHTGEAYEITFYFDPKTQIIRLKHQEKIAWTRRNGF